MSASLFRFAFFEEPFGYPERTYTSITTLKIFTHKALKAEHVTLGFRLILALYWTAWLLVRPLESSGWNGSAARAFALELAEWNALVMLAFLWVAALGVVKHQSRAIDVAACVLHDITVPTSLLILVMHWATHAKSSVSAYAFHVTTTAALVSVLDLTLSRFPLFLKHFYPSLGFLVAYLLFSGLMWRVRGVVVSPQLLDYRQHPVSCVLSIFAMLVIVYPTVYIAAWRYELAWFARAEAKRYHIARTSSASEDELLGVVDMARKASSASAAGGELRTGRRQEGAAGGGHRTPGRQEAAENQQDEEEDEEEVTIELHSI